MIAGVLTELDWCARACDLFEWMCWTWKKGNVSSCSSLVSLCSCGASNRLREGSTHTWTVFPFSVSPLVLTAEEFWQRSCLYLVAHLESGRRPKKECGFTRLLWFFDLVPEQIKLDANLPNCICSLLLSWRFYSSLFYWSGLLITTFSCYAF